MGDQEKQGSEGQRKARRSDRSSTRSKAASSSSTTEPAAAPDFGESDESEGAQPEEDTQDQILQE
eukprot:5809738-Lingulodinium_polyedra.AAC.1